MALPLGAGALQLTSLGREIVSRAIGLPEFAASLAGLRRPKKLRVRIVVLRDASGAPVAGHDEIDAAVAEANRVLGAEAATQLVPANGTLVGSLDSPAPREALEAPCAASGLWRTDLGRAGAFFRAHRLRSGVASVGRGAPLTVFVVRDVVGRCGCSLGPLGDYITIDPAGLASRSRRILAHELAHSCGLPHSSRENNLMRPKGPGERMTRLQRAVFRSSRHVTYL